MQSLICKRSELPNTVIHSLFNDRRRQFINRHKWDLQVDKDGCEFDEYDDELSDYLVVHNCGVHLGSCRVRPTNASSMIADHFSQHFPKIGEYLDSANGKIHEASRFCRSPEISHQESRIAIALLIKLLKSYKESHDIASFIAVVSPEVARLFGVLGIRHKFIRYSSIAGSKFVAILVLS